MVGFKKHKSVDLISKNRSRVKMKTIIHKFD